MLDAPAALRLNVMVATCSSLPLLVDDGSDDSSCTSSAGSPMVGVTVNGQLEPPFTTLSASM